MASASVAPAFAVTHPHSRPARAVHHDIGDRIPHQGSCCTAQANPRRLSAASTSPVSAFATAAILGGLGAIASRQGRRVGGTTRRRARGGEAMNNGSPAKQDFYEILGVGRDASEKDIKNAFRRLAKTWHPDVNKEPGAQERFQQITKAYETLSDAKKRSQYDQFGKETVGGNGAGPDLSSLNLEDLEAILNSFGSMFGGNNATDSMDSVPTKGADLQVEVQIPFLVACFGGDWTVRVQRDGACETCDGSGARKESVETKCRQCNGSGVTLQEVTLPWGAAQTQQVCPSCKGTTIDPSAACVSCYGSGKMPRVQDVLVKIPAGCSDGSQLRVRGKGDAGARGQPSGDLYISVKTEPSPVFQRDGFDIYTESTISVYDAMLGTKITTQTIHGSREINVPAGVQQGTCLRMKGKGVPKLRQSDERGDHYVRINVTIPRSLTKEQENLLEQLQRTVPQ